MSKHPFGPTPGDSMIKTILVPATGGDGDPSVFASALAVARRFDAHLEFLHVRPDAAAVAVSMAADGGGATMVGSLITRLEEEADQREDRRISCSMAFASARRSRSARPRPRR